MSTQFQDSDQVRYRYRPWGTTGGLQVLNTNTPLRQPSLSDSTNDLTPKYSEHNYRFGTIVQPDASQAFVAPFQFDNTDNRLVSASPRILPQQYLGDSYPGLSNYCSPSPSGSSYSSCDSKTWSEAQSGSWAFPDMAMCYSPQPGIGRNSIDCTTMLPPPDMTRTSSSCISLSEVQQFAEPDTEVNCFDGHTDYTNGLLSMHTAPYDAPHTTIDSAHQYAPPSSDYNSPPYFGQAILDHGVRFQPSSRSNSPNASPIPHFSEKKPSKKHRHSVSSPGVSTAGISKRITPTKARRISAPVSLEAGYGSSTSSRASRASQPTSSFPCPLALYGCASSFGSKNEWKRHVNTQHLRLDLWRCDQCNDRETRPNDFNRKDLFVQHLRRMHHKPAEADTSYQRRTSLTGSKGSKSKAITMEDTDPEVIAAERRCHIRLRLPPATSSCLFCPADFEGPGSWEERMEHVGRHLEQDKKEGKEALAPRVWRRDETVEQWLESEGLIVHNSYGWAIADGRRHGSRV